MNSYLTPFASHPQANLPVRQAGRRGFTLLELLLSVTIMSFIIVSLYGMFYHTQRALRMNVNQVDVLESTRTTLELIRSDFTALAPSYHPRGTNLVAFVSPVYRPVGLILPGQFVRSNYLYEAFLLKRMTDHYEAVVYRVLQPTNWVGQRTWMGVGILGRYATVLAHYDPDITRFALNQPATAFTPVLEGVVHFRIQVYDINGGPLSRFDPDLSYPDSVRIWRDQTGQINFAFLQESLPAYVEIELGVLERSAYQQLLSLPPGSDLARKFLSEHVGQIHFFRQQIPIWQGNVAPTKQP